MRSRRRLVSSLLACGAAAIGIVATSHGAAVVASPAGIDAPADLIVINGAVYAADGGPLHQAVAIRGNRIVAVGGNDDVAALRGPGTQIVDARGGAVVPGFDDVHTHVLSGGLEMDTVNLQGAQTLDEMQARIRAYAAAHRDLS